MNCPVCNHPHSSIIASRNGDRTRSCEAYQHEWATIEVTRAERMADRRKIMALAYQLANAENGKSVVAMRVPHGGKVGESGPEQWRQLGQRGQHG